MTEMAAILNGMRIGNVTGPFSGLFQIELSSPGEHFCLLFLAGSRGHFTVALHGERIHAGGRVPSAEVMAARKYLGGGRIEAVLARHADTILVVAGDEGRIACTARTAGLALARADGQRICGDCGSIEESCFAGPGENCGTVARAQLLAEALAAGSVTVAGYFAACHRACVRDLEKKIKARHSLLERISADEGLFSTHAEVALTGELVKSQLWRLERGRATVTLDDYFAETPGAVRTVEIDSVLTPAENLALFFKRAAKYKRGLTAVARRRAEVEAELGVLAARSAALEAICFPDFTGLAPLYDALPRGQAAPVRARPGSPRREAKALPYRLFEKEQTVIWAGKDARTNALVSLKLAAGNDLWFHAQNYPGSHVILRPKKRGHVFTDAEIREAAVIALYYSEARTAVREDVLMTEAKNVRRVPGAPLGTVSTAAGRTITVTLDDETVRQALFSRTRDI